MMRAKIVAVAVLVAAGWATLAIAGPGVDRIVVRTDRSVNCSTLATIVEDVTRGCKTDQEKAIALYNFLVRVIYMPWHSHQPLEMQDDGDLEFANDPLKYINVYGCCGCGPQAGVVGSLFEAAGFETRTLNPGFGHVSSEIKWGGKWRWMDIWLPAYVLDDRGEIYSYDEIMADRDRFAKAKQEHRAPGNFMVNYQEDFDTVMKAKGYKPTGRNPYEQRHVENLTLRPGESCTWLWDNVGKWFWPSGPWKRFPAQYLEGQLECGPACKFANDAVLTDAFPYWEPYKKTIENGPHPWNNTYYRYYGNAVFVHEPLLTVQGLADFDAKLTRLTVAKGGGLMLPDKPYGTVEMAFDLPYVIADTEIEGEAEMSVGGALSFTYSLDDGKTWLLGGEVKGSGPFGPISLGKPNSYEYPAGSTSGQYGFKLRIVFRTNSAKTPTMLKKFKVTNTTMLNFYSRPWLEVGANTVSVDVGHDKALTAFPLVVTWRWLEDWVTPKQHTHTVKPGDQSYVINAGGTKRPKMQSVTIACPAK